MQTQSAMTREDALALLDAFLGDCAEPPPPDNERAAQRFVAIISRHRPQRVKPWREEPGETPAEMARRHVRAGERHVARQIEILSELTDKGFSTALAEQLLLQMQELLSKHRQHLGLVSGSMPAP